MKLKCIETSQRRVEGYKLLEKHDIFKMHTFMHMVEYSLMTSVSKVEVRKSFETKLYCYRSFVMIATKDQVF